MPRPRLPLLLSIIVCDVALACGSPSADLGTGIITLQSVHGSTGDHPYEEVYMDAAFTRDSASRCTEMTDGPCAIATCRPIAQLPAPSASSADDVSGSSIAPNAGPIDIRGPGTEGTIRLAVDSRGFYPTVVRNADIWAPGDSLSVKAGGSSIGRFEQVIVAPSRLALTSPSLDHLTLDRSRPFHFAWSAVPVGDVRLLLWVDGEVKIFCRYPGGDGQADVPVSTLASLSNVASGSLTASVITETKLAAGGWNLTIVAETRGDVSAPFSIQ